MSSMRGAVTSVQALNWLLAFLIGTNTPRPLCHTGRASKSPSKSVIPCLPVTAGKIGAELLPLVVAREGLCWGQCA